MFLTEEELKELTGKVRRPSQAEVLNSLGIEHKVRPDGHIIVLKSHVEGLLDGRNTPKPRKSIEPNWAAING